MNVTTAFNLPNVCALVAMFLQAMATSSAIADAPTAPVVSSAALTAEPAVVNLSQTQVEGWKLYGVHCIYCHGAGPGRAGTAALARRVGKDSAVLDAREDLDRVYVQYVVRHGLNAMLPLRRTELTDTELSRIIDWLQRPRTSQASAGSRP